MPLCAASGTIAGPNCPQIISGWFIPGKSPIAACEVHRRIWIDNQTGRRFSGLPANPATAHQVVCEFWTSGFAKLFREAGLPRAAPPVLVESPSGFAGRHGVAGPRIVSPRFDRTYHVRLDARASDALNLEASSESARDRVYWFVDSAYLGTSPASTPLLWKPVVGRHTIRAVDELGRADAHVINIVAVE